MNFTATPSDHNNLDVDLSIANAIKNNLGADFVPEVKEGIQRFPAPGKPASNQSCWVYISSEFTFASFGSHITGEKHTWHANEFEKLSNENVAEARDKKRRSLHNRKISQEEAAEAAKKIINCSQKAKSHHSYLTTKRVDPHGLYQIDAVLIVPLYDNAGAICNVQRIYADHSKLFHKGGLVKGAYAIIGEPFSTDTLLICEGWATAATLHEDTGHPVIAAMNAGNLLDVCIIFATKTPPSVSIVVAADNDHRTKGNPGVTKGTGAAKAIGASITYPPLPCTFKDCLCTDFNDWNNCSYRVLEAHNA